MIFFNKNALLYHIIVTKKRDYYCQFSTLSDLMTVQIKLSELHQCFMCKQDENATLPFLITQLLNFSI